MAFRDGPIGDFKLPLSWTAGLATAAALLVALGLLFTDHRASLTTGGYAAPRGQFDELMEPVTSTLAAPVRWTGEAVDYVRGYFFAASENRRLKREIAELQRWKDAAIALKSINDRYETLLKLRTEPPIPSVAARITMDARGPFSNARLADAGTERGIKIGDPVLSQHGAVGRVVGVTQGASRILLLTDVDSRTPVMVDRSNARGILVGDGGPYPRLEYVRGQDPVRPGDVLLTSGDGGVYPRGLPVGSASKDLRGDWRARLYADRAPIDYVRILSFQDFSVGIDPKSLAPGAAVPPLTAEEQKGLQAAVAPASSAAKPATTAPAQAAHATPASTPGQGAPPPAAAPKPPKLPEGRASTPPPAARSIRPQTLASATKPGPGPKARSKASGKPSAGAAPSRAKPATTASSKPKAKAPPAPRRRDGLDGLH